MVFGLDKQSYNQTLNTCIKTDFEYQRTNGPVNIHLVSWPRKAQNIQNLENIW